MTGTRREPRRGVPKPRASTAIAAQTPGTEPELVQHCASTAYPRTLRIMTLALACLLALLAGSGVAHAAAPHISDGTDTDACAMCHRGHSASSDVPRRDRLTGEPMGSALIAGKGAQSGDVGLCLSCHGLESLGSSTDVETAFESTSAHTLAPLTSAFGPSPKDCSSCHDSHGTARRLDGSTYPALLRSYTGQDPERYAYEGDSFCGACHPARPGSTWDGVAVWRQTAHAREMTAPAGDVKIMCLNCHESHGSGIAPLITERLMPPAAPATTTIAANDRSLCLGCHGSQTLRTWRGAARFASSGHASSDETVAIDAEWPASGASRLVGECQNCHSPMGTSDGDGGVLPNLMNRVESDVCLRCHDSSHPEAPDLERFRFPAAEKNRPEIAMVWDPERLPEVFDMLSVFTQDTTGTAPRRLLGPREWEVQARTGNAAFGDVDGDGKGEVVVADLDALQLQVFVQDAMGGLVRTDEWLDVEPHFVEVADMLPDASGTPEIVVVTSPPGGAATLRLFRFEDGELTTVSGPYIVGQDVTGIAAGDVTGTPSEDIALTTAEDTLRVVTDGQLGALQVSPAYPTRRGPRGPSIGDAWDGAAGEREIVVANSGETTGTVSVFDGSGQALASYDATAHAGASAYDTIVGDVVPAHPGDETVVALRHPTGTSSVAVYERQAFGGLVPVGVHDTGTKYNTASLAVADVDGDTRRELLAGNAGHWGYGQLGVSGVAPSVQAFSFGELGPGTATAVTLRAGGAELAGGDPDVLAVDLGAVGRSGHPHEGVTGAHTSTETAGFTRQHAECVDCHDAHESRPGTSTAPYAPPTNTGARGVTVEYAPSGTVTYSDKDGVQYEYELCYKCHSGWSRPPGSQLDIASQFDTRGPSFHQIGFDPSPAQVPAGSFVPTATAWTNASIMLCTTCHTNADTTEPKGPHNSPWSPMLSGPYSGVASTDPDMFCYQCHKYGVYATGSEPGVESDFYGADLAEPSLHKLHVGDRGYTCIACHVTHGSSHEHLVRPGMDWMHYDTGGACFTPCHPGAVANVYSRTSTPPPSAETTPAGVTVPSGTTISGSLANIVTQDGQYLVLGMVGTAPGIDIRLAFDTEDAPTTFTLYGRYSGRPSQRVDVEIWDYDTSTWRLLGRLPDTAVDSAHVYPIPAIPGLVSPTGQMSVRLYRSKKGDTTSRVYIDEVTIAR